MATDLLIRRRMTHLGRWTARSGFTLVELLVVVSIIALLISILLPSLKGARDSAKAVVCGTSLNGLGKGLQTYASEHSEWIPGVNTSGYEVWQYSINKTGLQKSNLPVQTWDWITPLLRVQTSLPQERAQRFRVIANEYKCPSVIERCNYYDRARPLPVDNDLFVNDIDLRGPVYSSSYMMPAYFQMWGTEDRKLMGWTPLRVPINSVTPKDYYSVEVKRYTSRVNRVGSPAEKIAAADGTRYLDNDGFLNWNHQVTPDEFGAFTTAGAWWRGSTEYGDDPVLGGASFSHGKQIPLTYRHKKGIQALFFDNHVEQLSRRQTHRAEYWYPRGGVIRPGKAAEGYSDYAVYQDGEVLR